MKKINKINNKVYNDAKIKNWNVGKINDGFVGVCLDYKKFDDSKRDYDSF